MEAVLKCLGLMSEKCSCLEHVCRMGKGQSLLSLQGIEHAWPVSALRHQHPTINFSWSHLLKICGERPWNAKVPMHIRLAAVQLHMLRL